MSHPAISVRQVKFALKFHRVYNRTHASAGIRHFVVFVFITLHVHTQCIDVTHNNRTNHFVAVTLYIIHAHVHITHVIL